MTTVLLPSKGLVAGVSPAMLKRAALTLWQLRSAQPYDLAVVLGAPVPRVLELWSLLKEFGFIYEHANGKHYPTTALHSLATGRIGKPLPKTKAVELLAKMVRNAETANQNQEAMYLVTRIEVFGSFLDDTKTSLGDLDVAWELLAKPEHDRAIGYMFVTGQDPQMHMRGLVRPKSTAVRLMNLNVLKDLGFPSRVVYELNGPGMDEAVQFHKKQIAHSKELSLMMHDSISSILDGERTFHPKSE